MKQIVIQYEGESTTHARLTLHELMGARLVVEYGFARGGEFVGQTEEVLPVKVYPEVKAVHDGVGWNLEELVDLLGRYAEADEPLDVVVATGSWIDEITGETVA